MTSPVDELKPCPFCGESDDKKIHVHGPTCKKSDPYNPMDRLYPIVRCISCFASVHGKDEDESCKSAVVAWNTRAESPDGVEEAGQPRSTPPPVAGGELDDAVHNILCELSEHSDQQVRIWSDTLREYTARVSALQHQDGVVISRECAERSAGRANESREKWGQLAAEAKTSENNGTHGFYENLRSLAESDELELKQSLERNNGQ